LFELVEGHWFRAQVSAQVIEHLAGSYSEDSAENFLLGLINNIRKPSIPLFVSSKFRLLSKGIVVPALSGPTFVIAQQP
jgi:HD-like signal output (HDOD) protein